MKRLRLSPSQRVIAWRLVEPRRVNMSELVSALWGDRADGGPENTYGSVKALLFRLRHDLAQFGVEIVNVHGFGWTVPSEQRDLLRDILADEIARNTRDVDREHRERRLRRAALRASLGAFHNAAGAP